jgi:hypothetical protein
MSTEIALYSASVPDRMRYAEALAQASLLPEAYRRQPANVLLALESGAALGVAPMVAIQEIHVIKGKPTLSAQLQSALVRRAGHRLRVTGDAQHAVCEITRADDPDFTFRSEWTMERAKDAGLLSNDTWRKYPQNMLKARAISECSRDACPDVIVGFGYTAEELGDENDVADAYPADEPQAAAVERTSAPQVDDPWATAPVDVTDAEIVEDEPAAGAEARLNKIPGGAWLNDPDGPATPAQTRMLGALLKGQSRDQALAIVTSIVGREIESRADLTKAETSLVIDALKVEEPAS